MKLPSRRVALPFLCLAFSPLTAAQQDIVVVPPAGGSFLIKDGAGGEIRLEVTPGGETIINGRLLDLEPPVITIDGPLSLTPGEDTVTVTYSDNVGIFSWRDLWNGNVDNGHTISFGGDSEIANSGPLLETNGNWQFGTDKVISAYATDLAGNSSVATRVIPWDGGIRAGTYALDVPLNESLTGEGCGFKDAGTVVYSATAIGFSGYFKGAGSACDYEDQGENLDAIACLYFGAGNLDGFGSLSGVAAIESLSWVAFSKEQPGTERTLGEETYRLSTIFSAIFSASSTPPTVQAEISLKCDSSIHGIETYGPFQMTGTLVSP